jgi:hypothetical protein
MVKVILLIILFQLAFSRIAPADTFIGPDGPRPADPPFDPPVDPPVDPADPPCFTTQVCGRFHWTKWIDRDDPSGNGDYETVADAVSLGGCSNPIWI